MDKQKFGQRLDIAVSKNSNEDTDKRAINSAPHYHRNLAKQTHHGNIINSAPPYHGKSDRSNSKQLMKNSNSGPNNNWQESDLEPLQRDNFSESSSSSDEETYPKVDILSLPNIPFHAILNRDKNPLPLDSDSEDERFTDKDKNARLEEQIKLHHLQQLMHEFHIHKPDDIIIQEGSAYFPPKKEKRTPGAMNLEEFKDTVSKVLKTDEYDEYLEKLFTKLDTGCTGYVDWNEFCTYLLLLYRENDYMRTKREIPFLAEPRTKRIVHNRQETTSKILAVENPLRYISVSKEGVICSWYPSLNYEKHKAVGNYDSDQSGQKRRFKMWVTDAIYLPNCHLLALCSTSRDIHFFDVQNQLTEEFHVFGITDVPLCFDYWYDHKNPSDPSLLIFGGETGAINLLYFKQPVSQLFETEFKREGGAQKIFWTDVEKGSHNKWVTHDKIIGDRLPGQPPDIIKQVRYLPDNNSIIASTTNPNRSLFIADIQKLKKEYIFKIEKGVECFDYNKNLNILVTGSLDHILRIWNPYVTSKPIALLEGHATGVIGCKIHEDLMQIFSYSKDAVVKVWDIKEHSCLQTVTFKFDSSVHSMVSLPEHGHFPMHLQPSPQDLLLVTCNDYLGILKLGHTIQPKSLTPTTHDTQLCSAIYNKLFKQVVTGCDSSHIAVWDIETGSKSIVFSNAHGDEEITCMVFDESCRRLITGARNGTIKVWNFQNGHNLHKLEAVDEAEVTGILPLVDKKVILAVGWSRMITQYDDTDPDNMYVAANNSWKGGQLHKDDILSVDFCSPYLLATGSFDGLIMIWHLETERKLLKIKKSSLPDMSSRLPDDFSYSSFSNIGNYATTDSRPVSRNSRPNSRHRKSHRLPKGQPIPVDKLLFLKSRVAQKNFDGAKLVSSEAGYLRWWCLYGAKHEIGFFYVPDSEDESVLALCTRADNSIIITGDTQGYIKIWNITEYCLVPCERRIRTKPPLEATWRAHESAIVSVEYIEHTTGNYILSASTDKTARLWNLEGHYIGTFGQIKSWNLKIPSTWCHPKTPWSNDTEEQPRKTEDVVVENGLPDREPVEEKVEVTKVETEVNQDIKNEVNNDEESEEEPDIETFLGCRVTKQLETVKNSRIGRRNKFIDMDFNKETQKFGKLCSPFHALLTEDVANVGLPKGLPLSQRMLNRGYTSDTMTEDVLRNIDFSYGGPDTPPSGELQDKKAITGSREGKIHTAGLKRNTVKLAPLVLKKRHTVV